MSEGPSGDFACPACQKIGSKVIDSRGSQRKYIRRRRECLHCQHRFTTREMLVHQARLAIEVDAQLANLEAIIARLRKELALTTDCGQEDDFPQHVAPRYSNS